MKKTKSLKRILAGALAALMSISTVPLAFAAEADLFPAEGITVTAPEELVVSEGVLTGNPQLTVYNGSNHQMTDVQVNITGGVSVTLPGTIDAGATCSAAITGTPKSGQQVYEVTYTLDSGSKTYTSYGFSYLRGVTTPVATTGYRYETGLFGIGNPVQMRYSMTVNNYGVLNQTSVADEKTPDPKSTADLYLDRSVLEANNITSWDQLDLQYVYNEEVGKAPVKWRWWFYPNGDLGDASFGFDNSWLYTSAAEEKTEGGFNGAFKFSAYGSGNNMIYGKIPTTVDNVSVVFYIRIDNTVAGVTNYNKAQMNLNVKIVDKGALRSAIAAVSEKNYQSSNYTEDTYTAFYLALVDANKILGDFKSTQEQIDAAKTKLESAEKALKYAEADYTALDVAVERADQILNDEGSAGIYTQESLEALEAARDAAVALRDPALDFTHQAQVDGAVSALEKALDSMTGFADYSKVEMALGLFGKLNPDYYDTEAFEKVTELADAARNSLNDKLPADQQKTVDQMADDLLDAIATLEILDADTAKLETLIAKAFELISSADLENVYTPESIEALMEAYLAGTEVLGDNLKINQQATVDAAAEALEKAIEGMVKKPADKKTLEKVLAEAKAIRGQQDYKDYTDTSRKALEDAIASAQAMLEDDSLTVDDQEQITTEVRKLQRAIGGMQWKPADCDALNAAITKREEDVKAAREAEFGGKPLYTEASIAQVQAAIDYAKSVSSAGLTIKEQDEVQKALERLTAIQFEKNSADYTELEALIEEKQGLLNNATDDYTEKSKAALSEAIKAAREVVAKQYKIDEQGTVDAAVEALKAVELVLKDANFSVLEAAINAAEKFLADPDTDKLYTPEAIQTVRDALDQAKEVLGSDLTILEQEQVTQAADALNNAIAEAKGDYNLADVTALEDAVDAANAKLNAEEIADYTDTSVNALKEAVAKAQALIAENPNITRQDEVDAMADALNGMALVLKSADKSALEAAITAAEDLLATPDQYTDEFIKELEELLTKAEKMLGKIESGDLTIKDQAEVDAVVAELTGKTGQPGYKEADLKALNAAIEAAQAKINAPGYQNYTDDSRAALEAALDEAIALRNTKPNVTQQAAVNEAAEKLNGIQLVLKGANYDALNAAIAEIEALLKDADLSDRFTNASIEVLDAALKEAQAVLEAGYDASQQDIVDDAVDALEAARDGLVPYNKIEQGDIRIVGGDERVDDMIYHKTPWYQTYKSQTATLRLEGLEEGWKVVKWEAANWSVDEPEATFTVNDDGTVSVSPNGKGIGARSFWIKVTVEDANGNKATDIVKVRFYNWNWQK